MKIKLSFAFALLFICLFCGLSAQAQTSAFSYQGRLTNNSVPANAAYTMKFRLYGSVDQTDQIGTEQTVLVTVTNGIFTVRLDFGAESFPANSNRWLEVQIDATTLAPRTQLLAAPYAVRSLDANNADNAANADSLGGMAANQYALKTDTAPNALQLGGVSANNYLQKSGGTMTGALNLPTNGLTVGTSQITMSNAPTAGTTGNVMIGSGIAPDTFGGAFAAVPFDRSEKFVVNGNITVPAANNYGYRTPKTYRLKIGPAAFVSANGALYQARYDEGFSSATVNGLNSMWATGGSAGTVAYFIAPVNLPDQSMITALAAQLVKNGGSLQSIVELYRSDGTGYLSNTAQLIATATTTSSGGGIAYVNASSVNTSYNAVDNSNYHYFIRWSGEQNTQNVRLTNVTITYQVIRAD